MQDQLKAFATATSNHVYDPDFNGGDWMFHAVETAETLDNFVESSAMWAEKSAVKRGEIAGFPFVAWKSVQPKRGVAREALSVVDFGDKRVAIHDVDLTNFL